MRPERLHPHIEPRFAPLTPDAHHDRARAGTASSPRTARPASLGGVLVALLCACGTDPEPAADTSPDAPGTADAATDAPDTEIDAPAPDVDASDAADSAPDLPDAPHADAPDAVDVAPDVDPVCGANPAGCRQTGCPDGQVCWTDFWSGLSCTPSRCECDASTGTWGCTEDCGGGECVASPGAACANDADCPLGAQWCEAGACEPCNNDSVLCDISCEFGLLERNGCHPCACAPAPACGPRPQLGCVTADDCVAGQRCVPSALTVCFPSSCFCDRATGEWACTDDCLGSVCAGPDSACDGPNPAGCRTTGCADGQRCVTGDTCTPSSCDCDESTGVWACTEDCGGGVCEPSVDVPCATDDACAFGEEWCEDGACTACDNSGTACFLACGDGETLLRRNGCTPCECVPVNACTADAECGEGMWCIPGPECLHWCAAGDPTCCFGNRCVVAGP